MPSRDGPPATIALLQEALVAQIRHVSNNIRAETIYLSELVALARDGGATWKSIAEALGTTVQAAQQRFRQTPD